MPFGLTNAPSTFQAAMNSFLSPYWRKLSKCVFFKNSIEYMSHYISREGVIVDSKKIEAIESWPTPKTLKQLRGFLGLAGYYRRFITGALCDASISSHRFVEEG